MGGRFIDVIYEDRDILAVNKPRGLIVAAEKGEAGAARKNILHDDVKSYLIRKHPGAKATFVKPLHRLDRDTTGVVLFAKSNAGLRLANDIKEHNVRRTYVAIVEGQIQKESGTIKLDLAKGDFGFGKKVAVSDEGKETVTRFRVIERYEAATMVQAELETGFTHQIRVHFAHLGHPLVGDKVYNPHGKIKFPRQALHAKRVIFAHPAAKKKLQIEAPIPQDMTELIDRLRG